MSPLHKLGTAQESREFADAALRRVNDALLAIADLKELLDNGLQPGRDDIEAVEGPVRRARAELTFARRPMRALVRALDVAKDGAA